MANPISTLASMALTLVVVGITLGVGALTLTQVSVYAQEYNTTSANETIAFATAATTAVGTMGSWLSVVVIVAIAAVIIGLITTVFGGPGTLESSLFTRVKKTWRHSEEQEKDVPESTSTNEPTMTDTDNWQERYGFKKRRGND